MPIAHVHHVRHGVIHAQNKFNGRLCRIIIRCDQFDQFDLCTCDVPGLDQCILNLGINAHIFAYRIAQARGHVVLARNFYNDFLIIGLFNMNFATLFQQGPTVHRHDNRFVGIRNIKRKPHI